MAKLSAIRMTYEALQELLSLRRHIQIIDILADPQDRASQSFRVLITGHDKGIFEHLEGTEIPHVPLVDLQECRHVWRNKSKHDFAHVVCERCGKEGLVD